MRKKCRARRPDGSPCPNDAIIDSDYCAFHQPEQIEQQTKEFTREFTRELMRQGAISLIQHRLKDMAFALGLLLGVSVLVSLALRFFPQSGTSTRYVLLYGCGLKLPIAFIGVFLLRKRHRIGLLIPLTYVPLDLLAVLYYQQTDTLTPSLQAYYQLYWEMPTAAAIGIISLLLAVAGHFLGKLDL